jgi:hypothetical protein
VIAIRIGTRASVAGQMVGASNLDVGTYRMADGTEGIGFTAWLSIPTTGTALVGRGSEVRIGNRTFVVEDVVVGADISACEIRLSGTDCTE